MLQIINCQDISMINSVKNMANGRQGISDKEKGKIVAALSLRRKMHRQEMLEEAIILYF